MGEVIAPQVVSEIKAGVKTTEFYLSAIVSAAGVLVASGPVGNPVVKVAGLIVAVASALGYTASRTIVKS